MEVKMNKPQLSLGLVSEPRASLAKDLALPLMTSEIKVWNRSGGMMELSTTINGSWVSYCYQGHTLKTAINHFKDYVKQLNKQVEALNGTRN
jgi:hypothetical protein